MSIDSKLVAHAQSSGLKSVDIPLRNFAERVLKSITHSFTLQCPVSLSSRRLKDVLPFFETDAQLRGSRW